MFLAAGDQDDDDGGGHLRHVLAAAAHHHAGGRHAARDLGRRLGALRVAGRALARHVLVHVQPVHLLVDEPAVPCGVHLPAAGACDS